MEPGGCTQCNLCQERTYAVPGDFVSEASLMVVGGFPDGADDQYARPFIGVDGEILNRYLQEAGVSRSDISMVHVIKCKPSGGVTDQHLTTCSQAHLLRELELYRPKQILAVGKVAAAFFLGVKIKDVAITRKRGEFFSWKHPHNPQILIDVLITVDPSYIRWCERDQGSPYPALFLYDICAAKSLAVSDGESIPHDTGVRVRKKLGEGIKFTAGWHIGDSVYLAYRDSCGRLRHRKFNPPWYFLIREEDLTPVTRKSLAQIMRVGIKGHGGRMMRVKNVARDPEIPSWIRVYPEVPSHWVSKSVKQAMSDQEARRYVSVSPMLLMAQTFEAVGIRTFEADVDPLRRMMTDFDIDIETDGLRRIWVDIETDDETMRGRPLQEVIGEVPILSIACVMDDGQVAYRAATSTAAHHERELLEWFFHRIVPHFDLVVAWNGLGFDFPFLFSRARLHRVEVYPQVTVWWDAMVSFGKNHRWDAEKSLALDRVGEMVCGVRKVDRTGWTVKRMWQESPEFLKEYNVHDADLMRQIEEKTHYVEMDMLQNGLANCMPSNTYIGLRIDGLVLAEGYRRGTHFRTKFFGQGADDQYIGAFVLEPLLGRHYNIANFDFASLYPTTFTTFNISPDTYIPPNEVGSCNPDHVTRCPQFMVDGVMQGGECFDNRVPGIIPTIYTDVADRRAHYKKEMKRHSVGSPEYVQAKRLEYVWKTLGLSMYGTMGSIYARIFNRAVAQSVTLTAQFLMRSTMEMAVRMGYQPIYGDTDSVFVQIKDEDTDVPHFLKSCAALYEATAKRFNCRTNAIELEHEQTFDAIVFTGKKRYFGKLRTQKGRRVPDDAPPEVKGLEMRRSDGVRFARKIQEQLVHGLLYQKWDEERVRKYLMRVRQSVFEFRLTAEDLQSTSGLTKAPEMYKGNSRSAPHVRIAAAKIAKGEEVIIGQKISYIVTDGKKSPMEVVAVEDWDGKTYDPYHYWNKKIWPPVKRILEVLWPDPVTPWKTFVVRRIPVRRKRK